MEPFQHLRLELPEFSVIRPSSGGFSTGNEVERSRVCTREGGVWWSSRFLADVTEPRARGRARGLPQELGQESERFHPILLTSAFLNNIQIIQQKAKHTRLKDIVTLGVILSRSLCHLRSVSNPVRRSPKLACRAPNERFA